MKVTDLSTDRLDPTPVRLALGDAHLDLAPGFGGTILAWWSERDGRRIDWLRPTTSTPSLAGDTACFPLVPFSNRVRDGRFSFRGRTVDLPRVERYGAHFRHGFGCLRRWDIVERDARSAVIAHREDGALWPFPYEARQAFALSERDLSIRFSVTNTGRAAMPAGFGLHPYFPRTPRARIVAGVAGQWESDAEVMPVRLMTPPPAGQDPGRGIEPAATALDNVYTGWSRDARIEWPDRGARLTMTAEAPLDVLIVFTPPGKDFFCVEPVSNITDAFNLAAAGRDDTGMIVLEPGATVAATVTLRAERL